MYMKHYALFSSIKVKINKMLSATIILLGSLRCKRSHIYKTEYRGLWVNVHVFLFSFAILKSVYDFMLL